MRYILNRQQFEKGTLARWSTKVHKIIAKNIQSFVLDNNKSYKYYQLQLVKGVQHVNAPRADQTREQMMKDNRVKRLQRQEGIDTQAIINEKGT